MNHRISSSSIKPILIALALFFLITTIAASLAVWQSDESGSGDMDKAGEQLREVRDGEQAIGINIKSPAGSDIAIEADSGDKKDAALGANGSINESEQHVNAVISPPDISAEEISKMFNLDRDTALDAGESVKFKIENFQKLASQPLKFNIYNKDGSELVPDYIASEQGEKVHFFMAHANLREFQHLIPEYRNGVWNVQANMPTPGTYFAYIAVQPLGGAYTVYKKDLVVRSPSLEQLNFPDPTAGLVTAEGPYKVKMDMEQRDGYRIFNYKVAANDVVTSPQAYNEALGQMTIFAHGDPFTIVTLTASPTSVDTVGGLAFTADMLKSGRYTAFTEFKLDGKVYIFPFTFDIGA